MSDRNTAVGDFDDDDNESSEGRSEPTRSSAPAALRRSEGGFLSPYKSEQGKNVRWGTFIGLALLVVWGAKHVYDRLMVFEGDEWWRLLITNGIPLAFAVVLGCLVWWGSWVHPGAGDFMIATEGEMKKVSWSTRREVIGSTKVVIVVTVLLATLIFVVDIAFQWFFWSINVLKVWPS